MLTLSDASKAGKIKEFVSQEEARGIGPADRKKRDYLVTAHDTAIKTLAGIMMDPSAPARARSAAASILARSRARLRYDHATKSKTWHPK